MKGPFRILLMGHLLCLSASTSAIAAAKQTFEAEGAELIGGASKVADGAASEGYLVSLSKPGQGAKFAGLPAASKLAIRFASVEVRSEEHTSELQSLRHLVCRLL